MARALEQSAAPGLTRLESEVKCLLFADDLVLLSPPKEGLQQHLDLLHRFVQTWALPVNLSKTKKWCSKMVFQLPGPSRHHCPRAHKKRYLGLNIGATGNFHKAVNNLRDKARRAFYVIKRNIKFNIPIRIWQKNT